MNKSKIFILALSCLFAFACISCSNSNEAQQDFKAQALSPPSGIMAMNANGKHPKKDETDSTDWQTAPRFSGLFEVITPAYPNPVSYNASFKITINIKAVDAINGLYIYAFQQPDEIQQLNSLQINQQALKPGLQTITISPQEFAQSSGVGTFGNTYRIIMLDSRQRVITYGDVRVKR